MGLENINIPYELSIFSSLTKTEMPKDPVNVIMRETIKLDKRKRDAIYNRLRFSHESAREIVIKNKNLTLRLLNSNNYRSGSGFGKGGWYYVYLGVSSPDLQFSFIVSMETSVFLNILAESGGNLTDGQLHGTFRLCRYGGSVLYMAIQETPENLKEIEESYLRTKKLSTAKGTSKWIPGHRYIIKGQDYGVIYLGELKNIYVRRTIWNKNSIEFPINVFNFINSDWNNDGLTLVDSAQIFIKERYLSTSRLSKHATLVEYFQDLVNPSSSTYLNLYGMYVRLNRRLRCAVDVGPALSPLDSGVDLAGEFRKTLMNAFFENPTEDLVNVLLGVYPDLYESDKFVRDQVSEFEEDKIIKLAGKGPVDFERVEGTIIRKSLSRNTFVPRDEEEAIEKAKEILDKHNIEYM